MFKQIAATPCPQQPSFVRRSFASDPSFYPRTPHYVFHTHMFNLFGASKLG